MNIPYLMILMLITPLVFAENQFNDYASPSPAIPGAELSSRIVDLEVQQITLERRIKALEEQLREKGLTTSDQNDAYRMKPRHIEVLKKDKPLDRRSSAQYPIYPIVPMQNYNGSSAPATTITPALPAPYGP